MASPRYSPTTVRLVITGGGSSIIPIQLNLVKLFLLKHMVHFYFVARL